MKPKVAFFDFASCEGCQLQIANLEEDIIGLAQAVDIVSFREVMKERSDDFDIAFVEGSIQRPIDVERLEKIRSKAKILIALGACACTGGVNKLRNRMPLAETAREAYGKLNTDRNPLFDVGMTKALDEVVKVDFYIRGCPVRKEEILYYVNRLLTSPPRTNLDLRFDVRLDKKGPDERSVIQYNQQKCIMCRRCEHTCNDALDIHAIGVSQKGANTVISTPFDIGLDNNNCILCGQCMTVCPTGAFDEAPHVQKALEILDDADAYPIVVVDPIAITSCIGQLTAEEPDMGTVVRKAISALKHMGARQVMNFTSFTYLSAAAQAAHMASNKGTLFTSWCPSADIYIQKFYPEYKKYLQPESTPVSILQRFLKNKFMGEKYKVILITPCVTYKSYGGFDAVITAKELPRLFHAKGLDLDFFPVRGVKFDQDMGIVEKFITGGCSDYTSSLAILRAAYLRSYKNLDAALSVVTHEDYIHELVYDSEEGFLNALVIEDLAKAGKFLKENISSYRLVELYPCFRGCLSGGGQMPTVDDADIERRKALLKQYKGEVESDYEFISQIMNVYSRLEGGA